MKLEFFIAFRYLTRRKKAGFISMISLISVLGVAVGVMALIVVLAVMSGFDRELKNKIVGIHPHLILQQSGGIPDYEKFSKEILAMDLPKVIAVSPFVNGQAIIRTERAASGTVVRGVQSNGQEAPYLKKHLLAGDLNFHVASESHSKDDDAIQGGIVLGGVLATQLSVRLGDTVELISPSLQKKAGFRKAAKTETFQVTGVFHFGMHDVDAGMVLIDVDKARELYGLGDKVSGLAVRLSDVYWAERVKQLLNEKLNHHYWIESWIDMNRNFFAALQVEKNVMSILLFLIILVAAFNIVSTLIMVVMEKTKDIAILKTLGATQGSLKMIFLLEGIIVGLFGTGLGVVSGLLITRWLNPISDFIKMTTGFEVFPSDIYFFDKIPAQVNLPDVVLIASFAFITTLMAGLYPAKRAASLDPVVGLRYE